MPSETTTTVSEEIGRTPERQAFRPARKGAKASLPTPSPDAESSAQAQRLSLEPPIKKRRQDAEPVEELEVDLTAPEPLSKAEIRTARKKAKREELNRDDIPPKRKKDPEEKGEVNGDVKRVQKKRNSIWVGNLSFKTTRELLKDFVQRGVGEMGGESEGCVTRVNLPKKPGHGEFAGNKGFAYVDLATPELQAMAAGLSERMLEGRRLLIKLGDDHGETPNARTPRPEKGTTDIRKFAEKQRHPESATLFVGNLPFDATEQALRDLVESNAADTIGDTEKPVRREDEEEKESGEGEKTVPDSGRGGKKSGLRKVRLGAFEDTGRCKGFAFLDFHSPSQATTALNNRNNHYYEGWKLTIQYASAEATKRSGGRDASKQASGRDAAKKALLRLDAGPKRDAASAVERGNLYPPEKFTREAKTEEKFRQPETLLPEKDKRGKKWEAAGRPRPGAALAMAKREKVGIVEGHGQKIVFD